MIKLKEKPATLENLFESQAFLKFASFLLEKPMTIIEVARASGISRQTISNQLGLIPEYIEQPSWSPKVKGTPLRLKTEILSYYFSKRLNLDAFQKRLLDKIISDPAIQNIILKNNNNLGTALNKIISSILLIDNFGCFDSEIKNGISSDFITAIFKKLLSMQLFATKQAETKKSEFEPNAEELRMLHSALIKFSEEVGITSLTTKFRSSNFEIMIHPKDLHLLIQLAIKGQLFDLVENRKAKRKIEYWHKHPKTEEGKFIKTLEKQIGKIPTPT